MSTLSEEERNAIWDRLIPRMGDSNKNNDDRLNRMKFNDFGKHEKKVL